MMINFQFVRGAGLLLTAVFSGGYILAKNTRAKHIKELQLKVGDEVVRVPPKILNLFDEILYDMESDRGIKVIPYMSKTSQLSNGFDIIGLKSYIGIPQHFIYDLNNNENFEVVIDGKEIPQDAPEYESLKRLMCLSREAKKFAIAREIYESQNSPVARYFIMPSLVIMNSNILSYVLEKTLSLREAYECNILIFLCTPLLCVLLLALLEFDKEYYSDLNAAKLGTSYIQGGLEYYEKLIQRNKILKSLNVDAPYTEKTSMFRGNHWSLQNRIACLKEIDEGKERNLPKTEKTCLGFTWGKNRRLLLLKKRCYNLKLFTSQCFSPENLNPESLLGYLNA